MATDEKSKQGNHNKAAIVEQKPDNGFVFNWNILERVIPPNESFLNRIRRFNIDLNKQDGRPLISASDVDEKDFPYARVDNGILVAAMREAKKMSIEPTHTDNFKVGRLGAYVTGTYFGKRIDRTIYGDWQGDGGRDLTHRGRDIDVKTVSTGDLELRVDPNTIGRADWYVLCDYQAPTTVRIIGIASTETILRYGEETPYDRQIHLPLQYITPLPYRRIEPDEIRCYQSLNDN